MSEHNITIDGATFHLRKGTGGDARHLIKIRGTTAGTLEIEPTLDPAKIALFVEKIERPGEAAIFQLREITQYLDKQMSTMEFFELANAVFALAVGIDKTAKNSDSSSTSHKTRKGEDNLTARDALG